MIFHYKGVEVEFEDSYIAKVEKEVGQPFEEFMLHCIDYYLEKEELRKNKTALKNVVVAGHSIAMGWMDGDATLPENKDKEIITIYYNDLPIEFKKKNVELYENVLLSKLSDMAIVYVDMDLQDKSLIGNKDAVKEAIVSGMNDELSLYDLGIVEELREVEEEPGKIKIFHIVASNIEERKTEKVLGASAKTFLVWADFPIKQKDIIQIDTEFYSFYRTEVLYDLDKLNEFFEEERRRYGGGQFCKGIVRNVTGDSAKIYQTKALGKDLAEIILNETKVKGKVEILKFYK